MAAQETHHAGQLLQIGGEEQGVGRAADAHGGVPVQRLVQPDSIAENPLRLIAPCFGCSHSGFSFSVCIRWRNSIPIFQTLPAPWVRMTSEGFAMRTR